MVRPSSAAASHTAASHTASSQSASRPRSVVATAPLQPAANDAAAQQGQPVPRYVVPAGIAAEFLREAMALDPAGVGALPYDADAQVSWMERIQGSAWADRSDIVVVTAHDAVPVTVEAINRFGLRVEWVRGLLATRNVSTAVTAVSVATMPTAALEAHITAHQRTLHRAFMYQFRSDPAQRKRLREAQVARVASRVSSRSRLLLALAVPPEANAWLRSLPRGEGAALDALQVMHPEWVARTKNKAVERSQVDVAARAFATLDAPLRQLLDAGRYLTQGRADRKDAYPGYHPPKTRKPRTPKTP